MNTVSVVLSTYNGVEFLPQLLDSLRCQTRMADEVIISDDASTDDSVDLVRSYIEMYGLENWRLITHEINVGWKTNFKRAILACNGDLIFPCDQDDIWDEHKIELMSEIMENSPNINLIACQVDPFYEGKSDNYRADLLSAGDEETRIVDLTGNGFLYVMRPGCSYCLRATFAHDIAPWWKDDFPHDAVLWRFAAITGSLAIFQRPLVKFRRHENNASTRGFVTRDSRMAEVRYYIDFFDQVKGYLIENESMTGQLKLLIDNLHRWFNARMRLLEGNRDIQIFSSLVLGRRWYSTWKSPLVDIFLNLFPSGKLHV